jgi:hypothetical protein
MYQLDFGIIIPIKPFFGHHFKFALDAHITKNKTTSTP